MSLLSVALAVLAGGMVIALFLGRRRWRARPSRGRASTRLMPASPRPLAAGLESSPHDRHDSLTMDPGVWRPPSRQELMRRQAVLRQAAQRLAGPGARRVAGDSRRHGQIDLGAWAAETNLPEQGEVPAVDQAPWTSVEGTRVSRIGRKREGLESLITATPSDAEGHRHESKTR